MDVNKYGQSLVSSSELRELLLKGKNISHLNVVTDDEIVLYNTHKDILSKAVVFLDPPAETMEASAFYEQCANEWFIPETYRDIDVYKWLIDKCNTQQEIDRVNTEYVLFEQKELIIMLRLFIFIIDHMRHKGYIWGVGRGSAVSSFCLYLIGVHHVNSLKYDFDIRDFLK